MHSMVSPLLIHVYMLIPLFSLFSLSPLLSLPPPPLPTHPLSTLQHPSIQQRLLGFVAQSADRLGARGVHWRHIHWNGEPLFKEEWQYMYHILYVGYVSAVIVFVYKLLYMCVRHVLGILYY